MTSTSGRIRPALGAQADIDDGVQDGLRSSEQSELVQLRRERRRLEMEEILRRATAYFAKDALQMTYPLVLDQAAEGIPVPWQRLAPASGFLC